MFSSLSLLKTLSFKTFLLILFYFFIFLTLLLPLLPPFFPPIFHPFLPFSSFLDRVSYKPHKVTENKLVLLISLNFSPKCRDYKHVLSHLILHRIISNIYVTLIFLVSEKVPNMELRYFKISWCLHVF